MIIILLLLILFSMQSITALEKNEVVIQLQEILRSGNIIQLVKTCIKEKIYSDSQTADGDTLFHLVNRYVENKQTKIDLYEKLFVAPSKNIYSSNFVAIENKKGVSIQQIFEKESWVLTAIDEQRNSILHRVIMQKNKFACEVLAKLGAYVDVQNEDDDNAYHLVDKNFVGFEKTRLLHAIHWAPKIQNSMNLEKQNKQGKTAESIIEKMCVDWFEFQLELLKK